MKANNYTLKVSIILYYSLYIKRGNKCYIKQKHYNNFEKGIPFVIELISMNCSLFEAIDYNSGCCKL